MGKKFCILPFYIVMLSCYNLFAQIDNGIITDLENTEISGEETEALLDAADKRNNNLLYKFNINEMSREDMLLLGLNNFQIFSLQNYIRRTGQLYSVNELQFVNGFDAKTIEEITPYICAEPVKYKHPMQFDSIFSKGKQDIRFQYVRNLKTPYGFTRDDGKGFKGDNFSSSFRYKMKYYDWMEFSLTGEKDYGEPLYYKNKIYGYDHYAVALTLRDIGKYLKQLTVGNYRLNIGEGLAIKQSFSLGYLSSYSGAKHSNADITPFRSTSEYNYNTGIASKIQTENFDILLFGSYTPVDFNGNTVQQTGYHRTEAEILCKDSNAVAMGGASVQYWNRGFNLGLTAFAYHYTDSLHKGKQTYQQYNFEGKDNNIISLNISYPVKNWLFFSEFARSDNNAFAGLLGLQISMGYKTSFSVVARDYSAKYHNHYADAIGIQSYNRNERGIYLDYSAYWNKKLQTSVGMDWFYFPMESYRANQSAYGQKAKMQIIYHLNESNELNFYLRLQNRQYNDTIFDGSILPCNNIIFQPQLKYIYTYSGILTLVYRAGYSHSFTNDSKKNYGFYNYIELISRPAGLPLSFNFRWTYFRTMDYDNRFYIYEYSLPLSYSSALLYNTGNKMYAMVGLFLLKNLKIYIRYSLTRYNNTDVISSGNTKISGNLQHYLGGQIYYQF